MKIGDLVRLKSHRKYSHKNLMKSEKDFVGILIGIDSWRPVGTVCWAGGCPWEGSLGLLSADNVYLRDIELVKQAKTKAV